MSAQADTYKVDHRWGDPREPEYQNGHLLSTVAYRENGSSIHFRIIASNDKHSSNVKWLVVAPAGLRRALDKRWSDRELIFCRIIDHLKRIDSHQGNGRYFSNIEMDVSRVEGWLTSKINQLKTEYPLITISLPVQEVFMLLAIGFLFHSLSQSFNLFQGTVYTAICISIGVLSIILMIKDFKKSFSAIVGFYLMQSLMSKRKDWLVKAVRNIFKVYWQRYLVTLVLSILLIKLSIG